MVGKIILLIIILFLSLEYICSQKEILVSTYHIRKTKIVKIVESILAMLGIIAYYMNLIDYYWLSEGLLIVAVIWQFIVIYVHNKTALKSLSYNSEQYMALKKELWKEYLYIVPKTIFFMCIFLVLLIY